MGGETPESVTRTQWIAGMILESSGASKREVEAQAKFFDKMANAQGRLDTDAIQAAVSRMQEERLEAAGAAADLVANDRGSLTKVAPDFQVSSASPQPEPEAATQVSAFQAPVVSAAELLQVAAAAEKAVLQLLPPIETVQIDVMKRTIDVLRPIEFVGVKSSRNVGENSNSDEGSSTAADRDYVNKMCNEVAVVLGIFNDKLREMRRRPFGLLVGGHTSATLHSQEKSERLSLERAQIVADGIRRALVDVDPERERGTPTVIVAKGFGSSRPLPNFADGKNHPENRRVELKVLVGDDADDAVTG